MLYEIEESVREGDSEDILRACRERSLPIVEEFLDWLGMELTSGRLRENIADDDGMAVAVHVNR